MDRNLARHESRGAGAHGRGRDRRDGRIKELRAYYEDTVPLIEAADGVKGKYNPGVG